MPPASVAIREKACAVERPHDRYDFPDDLGARHESAQPLGGIASPRQEITESEELSRLSPMTRYWSSGTTIGPKPPADAGDVAQSFTRGVKAGPT